MLATRADAVVPATPGRQTSEYRVVQVLIAVGLALQGLAGGLATLPADVQQVRWVAVASAVCGTLLQLVTALRYIAARTELKTYRPPEPPATT